jgi:hypothetical protein
LKNKSGAARIFLGHWLNGNKAETLRGGSWNNNPRNVRVSNRNRNEPGNRNNNIGFRCVGDAGNACQTGQGESRAGFRSRRERHARFRALVPANRYRAGRQIQNHTPALW